jgi:hypothetical protein
MEHRPRDDWKSRLRGVSDVVFSAILEYARAKSALFGSARTLFANARTRRGGRPVFQTPNLPDESGQ